MSFAKQSPISAIKNHKSVYHYCDISESLHHQNIEFVKELYDSLINISRWSLVIRVDPEIIEIFKEHPMIGLQKNYQFCKEKYNKLLVLPKK